MAVSGVTSEQTSPQVRYLLRVNKETNLSRVLKAYGLTELKNIAWLLNLHVVTGPSNVAPDTLVAQVIADRYVVTFEPDYVASNGEMASARPDLQQSTDTLNNALSVDRTLTDFYGALAWTGYGHQAAFDLMSVPDAQTAGQLGDGVIVAVIDSGIDPYNAVLKGVLLPGYDFTRDIAGADEFLDLDGATTTVLQSTQCSGSTQQSTAAIMDSTSTSTLQQSTAAIMDGCGASILTQSTAAIMDSTEVQQLATVPPLPMDFGHGTMVAGLIHAIAPKAKILPIKAFSADGTGRASNIAQAIYWAWLQGARVINMSFTFPTRSNEVMYATAYAALGRSIPVAAAGNEGLPIQRWPAEH